MAQSTTLRAKNNTGSTLTAGTVVFISGFDTTDQIPFIAIASNDDEDKMTAIGVVREDILNGDTDIIKTGGAVGSFDTSSTNVNDPVYVGQNGGITFVEPSSISENLLTQQIGVVLKVDDFPDGQIQLFHLEVKSRVRHTELIQVEADQHHVQLHARQHELSGNDVINHNALQNLTSGDVHKQYSLANGTRAFTGTVSGVTPTDDAHLTTKSYVDLHILQDGSETFSGSLGIKRTAAVNDLEVEGTASKTTATAWLANSDRRIKMDIKTISNGLNIINQLNPVSFKYLDKYIEKHPSIKKCNYYNFIAQEFQDIFPHSVQDSGEDGILQIETGPVTPHLVSAVQELSKKISLLRKENDDLRARLVALEEKLK
jgi:hypothetical protein